MKKEIWVSIPELDGFYEASSNGRIKSLSRMVGNLLIKETILSLKPTKKDGYVRLTVYMNGEKKKRYAHRLVCSAFHKKIHGKKQVNHKDGNKANNKPSNLEWASRKDNARHARDVLGVQMMGEKHYMTKFTETDILAIMDMRKRKITLREIAAIYKVHGSTIGKIVTGVNWKHVKAV